MLQGLLPETAPREKLVHGVHTGLVVLPCEDARKTRAYIEEQVYITKAKDYTNSFRGITYRNDAERDAVLGKVEDNSFIKIANKDTAAFNAMLDAVRG